NSRFTQAMASQFAVPPDIGPSPRANPGGTGVVAETALQLWRRLIEQVGIAGRQAIEPGSHVLELYLRAWAKARAGNLKATERHYADVVGAAPMFAPALEAHGEALDRLGDSDLARVRYDLARKLRAQTRRGAPDRCFALRNRRSLLPDIASYTAVLH